MDVEVLKEDAGGFEMQIAGEDHGFLNLLTYFLDRSDKVERAAYKVEHPLVGVPKLFFMLKGLKAEDEISVKDLKGVGPKTADQLEAVGIDTAGKLLLSTPEKVSERTGIAAKLLEKYFVEARKLVPEDTFGYRAVLKETLAEMSKEMDKIKKGV
jgi:DNA-directed RNA polymerase subunit L